MMDTIKQWWRGPCAVCGKQLDSNYAYLSVRNEQVELSKLKICVECQKLIEESKKFEEACMDIKDD